MISISIISFFIYRHFALPANCLIPITAEHVDAGVVVLNNFINREFLLDQHRGGNQTHVVVSVLYDIIYQLLAELLIVIESERIALK